MSHSPVPCKLFNLCHFISTSKEWKFLLCCSAWSERPFSTFFIMVTAQYLSNKSKPNIFVNVVSSDHRVCCKEFCFGHHCLCKIWSLLMRSCHLIIEKDYRYKNHRYYVLLGRKNILCRNCDCTLYLLNGIPQHWKVAYIDTLTIHAE